MAEGRQNRGSSPGPAHLFKCGGLAGWLVDRFGRAGHCRTAPLPPGPTATRAPAAVTAVRHAPRQRATGRIQPGADCRDSGSKRTGAGHALSFSRRLQRRSDCRTRRAWSRQLSRATLSSQRHSGDCPPALSDQPVARHSGYPCPNLADHRRRHTGPDPLAIAQRFASASQIS